MDLNVSGIELERVSGPPDWMASRDAPFEPPPGAIVEWYRGRTNGSDYVRVWTPGGSRYEEDIYTFVFPEDYDDEDEEDWRPPVRPRRSRNP